MTDPHAPTGDALDLAVAMVRIAVNAGIEEYCFELDRGELDGRMTGPWEVTVALRTPEAAPQRGEAVAQGAGWSTPPEKEADHDERLSSEELRALGLGVSEWAYNHLANGYAVSLTVREVKRLIAALRPSPEGAEAELVERGTRLLP